MTDSEAWGKIGIELNNPKVFFEYPLFKILTQDGAINNEDGKLKIKYRLLQMEITEGIDFNTVTSDLFEKQIEAINEKKDSTDLFVIRVKAGASTMGLVADYRIINKAKEMFSKNYIIEGLHIQKATLAVKVALNMLGNDMRMSDSKILIDTDENMVLEFMAKNLKIAISEISEKKKNQIEISTN